MEVAVNSEIGKLGGVIIHTPGDEVENMTPKNAERALYSDILNLAVAGEEYSVFSSFLKTVTKVYEIKKLLTDVLMDEEVKTDMLYTICRNENAENVEDELIALEAGELTDLLIEGVELKIDNLTSFLSEERYSLSPLHNFFFTRDSSVALNNEVLICNLSNAVREREAIIMQTIFKNHPDLNCHIINPRFMPFFDAKVRMEGGDILIARDDVILVGTGSRTSTQGIDYLVDHYKQQNKRVNILVQELPLKPESFIHLDMVFTFLSEHKCCIYEQVILNQHAFQTVNITVDNGKVHSIKEEANLLRALKKLGMEMEPVICGGDNEDYIQEREQWHSGANFFAIEPGKVMAYRRNSYTLEAMSDSGFEILRAEDILSGKDTLPKGDCVITVPGSELSRGGGGCRCMTMPVRRESGSVSD
ncbi:MAG: hypothetical protein K9G57_11100 [Ignavibacteriales bacterium]|nr:hypothetical protein [Ignavibacteriales bacterium]MCF8437386.1 hypothetical protein [Ignavibacteriales bacterium]